MPSSATERAVPSCAAHGIEAELLRRRLERDVGAALGSGLSGETLEQLRQDVVQSQASARLRIQSAALRVREEQTDRALELLKVANDSIGVFRRRASLWRDLAADELGSLRPLDLTERLRELVDLLETEVSIRRVSLALDEHPATYALVDPRAFTRTAFRRILEGFELAGEGGAVRIRVEQPARSNEVHLSFVPVGPGGDESAHHPDPVVSPLAEAPA